MKQAYSNTVGHNFYKETSRNDGNNKNYLPKIEEKRSNQKQEPT
jgi:hypothetical protein